jgi:hypothetical protein
VNVHIEHKPWKQQVSVWIYQRDSIANVTRWLQLLGSDERRWEEIPEGADLPDPTLILSPEEYDALADAIAGAGSPSKAQARHLDDAVGQRDRLTDMVEKLIGDLTK